MAYVELNPIRAKMADSPENSEFTSIKQRINEVDLSQAPESFEETEGRTKISLKQFLDRNDRLKDQLPSILQRLGIDGDYWC